MKALGKLFDTWSEIVLAIFAGCLIAVVVLVGVNFKVLTPVQIDVLKLVLSATVVQTGVVRAAKVLSEKVAAAAKAGRR